MVKIRLKPEHREKYVVSAKASSKYVQVEQTPGSSRPARVSVEGTAEGKLSGTSSFGRAGRSLGNN